MSDHDWRKFHVPLVVMRLSGTQDEGVELRLLRESEDGTNRR